MKALFNAAVKAIAAKTVVHPEAINAVYHYFFGGGKERHLPEEYHQKTKEAILYYLRFRWAIPCWGGINTARVNDEGWYKSLAGVVGAFNFDIEAKEDKVVFHCWDKWDFNIEPGMKKNSYGISIPTPDSDGLKKLIVTTASMMGIEVCESYGYLRVSEQELASLNKGREYYTRWDIEISEEELAQVYEKAVEDNLEYDITLDKEFRLENFDWEKGGLSKDWIKQQAFLRHLKNHLPTNKAEITPCNEENWRFVFVTSLNMRDVIKLPVDWSKVEEVKKIVEGWEEIDSFYAELRRGRG